MRVCRIGRTRDPDADERAFLRAAIAVNDQSLRQLSTEREKLIGQLGDPDQVRSERNGIHHAVERVRMP